MEKRRARFKRISLVEHTSYLLLYLLQETPCFLSLRVGVYGAMWYSLVDRAWPQWSFVRHEALELIATTGSGLLLNFVSYLVGNKSRNARLSIKDFRGSPASLTVNEGRYHRLQCLVGSFLASKT